MCYANFLKFIYLFFFNSHLLDFSNTESGKVEAMPTNSKKWQVSSSIDIPKLDELSYDSVGKSTSPSRALKLTTANSLGFFFFFFFLLCN